MRDDTWSGHRGIPAQMSTQAPPYRGSVVHHHDHCGLRCPYCGPDSSAWAVGEFLVASLVAVGRLAWWFARHPAAVVAAAIVVTVVTVLG
jgi:hypothetical protein